MLGSGPCAVSATPTPKEANAQPSRLLLVTAEALPQALVQALHQSPVSVEELGPSLLGSGEIQKSDCVLVGDVTRLEQVVQALEKKSAANIPVFTIAHPSELRLDEERLRGLQLTVLPRTWDTAQVVGRLVQLVVLHLKNVGELTKMPKSRPPPKPARYLAGGAGAEVRAPRPGFTLPRPETKPRVDMTKTPRGFMRPSGSGLTLPRRLSQPPPLPAESVAKAEPLGDTPPTKLSLHAPPSLKNAGQERSLGPSASIQVAEVLPQPPPSSHRRRTSAPSGATDSAALGFMPADLSVPRSVRRFSLPPASMAPDGRTLRATRWVVVDDDEARLQAVATCLRQMGATVETTGLKTFRTKLPALRAFDAIGFLIDERELRSAAEFLHALELDPRLCWMRLVALRLSDVFDPVSLGVVTETLTRCLELRWETEWETLEQLVQGVEIGVERLGMPRILRAVSHLPGPRSLRVASLHNDWALECLDGSLVTLTQDGTDVRTDALAGAMDALLELAEGAVLLEVPAGPVEGSGPALNDILRNHAQRLAQRPALLTAVSRAPWMAEARARWAERLRSSRLSLALGASAALLSCLVVALIGYARKDAPSAARRVDLENLPAQVSAPSTASATLSPTPRREETQAPKPNAPPVAQAKLPALSGQCERLFAETPGARARRSAPARWAWNTARKSLLAGDLATAEAHLCKSAELDPAGPGAVDLVRLYLMRGDSSLANASAQWALLQQPGDPTLQQLLADAMNQSGDVEGARALLLTSMNLPPSENGKISKVARRFVNAGYQVLKGDDPAQAERMFRRAVALDPENLPGVTGLADLLLRRKNVAGASRFARQAAELGPRDFQAQFVYAEVLAAEGDAQAAKTAYQVALQLNPNSSAVRQRLGIE